MVLLKLPVCDLSNFLRVGILFLFYSSVKYVKHGHVRIGPNVISDPAFLVTRNHEDFITWTEKFRDNIDVYYDTHDDYKD